MRKVFALLVLVAVLVGGWYFASPWLAMKGLVDDAQAGDLASLEERIDFVTLRENTRNEVRDQIAQREGRGGLLDRIGGEVAGRIANEAINRAVTPEGLAAIVVSGGLAAPLVPDALRGQELSWDVEREGIDSFRAISTFEDGSPGPVLMFARDGLGWDMVGITLGYGG